MTHPPNDQCSRQAFNVALRRITALKAQRDLLLMTCTDLLRRHAELLGTDCECDNTHAAVGTVCGLCEAREAIAAAET